MRRVYFDRIYRIVGIIVFSYTKEPNILLILLILSNLL